MNIAKNKPGNKKPLVLVLFGSPHQNGASAKLLRAFLEPLAGVCDTSQINAFEETLAPCTGCRRCEKEKGCWQGDFAAFDEKVRAARVLVMAFPVYFLSYPAPLKAIADRFEAYWSERFVQGVRPVCTPRKTGVLLAAAGSDDSRCRDFLMAQTRMVYSVVDASIEHSVFWMGTDMGKGGEEALCEAKKAGEAVAEALSREQAE